MLDVGHGERELQRRRRQQQWGRGEQRAPSGHELVLVRRGRISGQTEAAEPVAGVCGGEGQHHDGHPLLLHVHQQLAVLHRQLRPRQQGKQRARTHPGGHAHRDLRVEAADAARQAAGSHVKAAVSRRGRFSVEGSEESATTDVGRQETFYSPTLDEASLQIFLLISDEDEL